MRDARSACTGTSGRGPKKKERYYLSMGLVAEGGQNEDEQDGSK